MTDQSIKDAARKYGTCPEHCTCKGRRTDDDKVEAFEAGARFGKALGRREGLEEAAELCEAWYFLVMAGRIRRLANGAEGEK